MTFDKFIDLILEHEGLEEFQTPFRIMSPKMGRWVSMFDDTIKIRLNPDAVKSPGREKFLYTVNAQDVKRAVEEQFRRYARLHPTMTIADTVKIFDQTGSKTKNRFLEFNDVDTTQILADIINT